MPEPTKIDAEKYIDAVGSAYATGAVDYLKGDGSLSGVTEKLNAALAADSIEDRTKALGEAQSAIGRMSLAASVGRAMYREVEVHCLNHGRQSEPGLVVKPQEGK